MAVIEFVTCDVCNPNGEILHRLPLGGYVEGDRQYAQEECVWRDEVVAKSLQYPDGLKDICPACQEAEEVTDG